jgi:DNA polymerase III epsilon subunit-like protein
MLGELNISQDPLASELHYTGWDFEGIGTYPVELGVVSLQKGELRKGLFSRLYAPIDLSIPAKSPMFGYDLAKNQDSPRLWEMWPTLASYWQVHCFVGHNIGTERKYLHAFPLHPAPAWLDTLKLVRYAYPKMNSHTLGDVLREFNEVEETKRYCEECGFKDVSEHNPLYDAVGCVLILRHLLKLPGWEKATLHQLMQLKPVAYYKHKKSLKPRFRFQRSF